MSQGRNTIAVHSRLQRRCHWNGAPLGTIRCQQLLGGFVHRFVRPACVVPASCDRFVQSSCSVCMSLVRSRTEHSHLRAWRPWQHARDRGTVGADKRELQGNQSIAGLLWLQFDWKYSFRNRYKRHSSISALTVAVQCCPCPDLLQNVAQPSQRASQAVNSCWSALHVLIGGGHGNIIPRSAHSLCQYIQNAAIWRAVCSTF